MAKRAASGNIDSVLQEKRSFPPSAEFSRHAHIPSLAEYERLWDEAKNDPQTFWARYADELVWSRRWDKVLEWREPYAQWFVGATTNVSVNCIDRHLAGPRKNRAAIVWEGEPGDSRLL